MLTRKITSAKKSSVKLTKQTKATALSVAEFLALKDPKGNLTLAVDGEHVSLTNLERVYWPDEKITKFDLLRYYLHVSPHLMPFLKNRPAILQRWPRGVNAPMFFQQDLESAPAFVKTVRLTNQEGRDLNYAVYTNTASLLHFVNLGTIEQHPWHSTTAKLDQPDWVAIDLDPKKAPWENVLQVALIGKEVCDEIGLTAFPKTSGSSGIHIYVPLKPVNKYERVAEFSRLLAGEIARRAPKIATVERTIAKRKKDQVYVDWMQNARGKSLAAVFTARAKPKATVSMPLTWKQIEQGVKISDFTVRNAPALLAKKGDAWSDFFNQRQKLKLS
ncbi:MAG TPA: DNA polymerase LigD [Blastocatellia bacterium]|jgi:bifunctional non-homologous end joining protein LigD|nr:DNA polymerase LigD [Blastocatellia bacterium]HAF22386.1 DNA polymerase LigD [Blastocatellia bacterium]HCX30925.1 DNA polymerase LigD [Blastocatellia bacterium]